MYDTIAAHRYISRGESAGQHSSNVLYDLIHEYPDRSFLALFRMHKASFWHLVDLLQNAGGEDYWKVSRAGGGPTARPVYQQVAVALYMLGGYGGGVERERIALNIGKGTAVAYLWRTIAVLIKILPEYLRWPIPEQREQWRPPTTIFRRCIGFLDGSIIILKDKPRVDPEAYFS
ncbi:hypothetical protein BDZ91DRAFT_665626, partial [Kalaharituber pfeilii]